MERKLSPYSGRCYHWSHEIPTFAEFLTRIGKDFKAANKERDAAHQIAMLRQGKKTAEETIMEFRLLTNQAGYANTTESDHLHLIDKLQTVLNTNLVKRILLLDSDVQGLA